MIDHSKKKAWGLLVLRLAAGVIFLLHGWSKLQGIDGVEGFFGTLGIPLPGFMAWVVALVEFVGGILLIAGLWVRPAAVLLAIVMLVAFSTAKKFSLPQGDPDLALLAISIALALMGPGRLSAAHAMGPKWDDCCEPGQCEPKEMPKG